MEWRSFQKVNTRMNYWISWIFLCLWRKHQISYGEILYLFIQPVDLSHNLVASRTGLRNECLSLMESWKYRLHYSTTHQCSYPSYMYFVLHNVFTQIFAVRKSFIHLVCIMTDPQHVPKHVLQRVQSSAYSFNFQYPLFSLRSSSS